MRTVFKWTLIIVILLVAIFLLGPRAKFNNIDVQPVSFDIPLEGLDAYVTDRESEISDVKPGNEAKIIWADSIKKKTDLFFGIITLPVNFCSL